MTPEQEAQAAQSAELEEQVVADATEEMSATTMVAIAAIAALALAGDDGPGPIRNLIRSLLPTIELPSVPRLIVGIVKGKALGYRQTGLDGNGAPANLWKDASLDSIVEGIRSKAARKLADAVKLSTQLSMTNSADTTVVLAKAHTALNGAKADAAWAVHRAIALGAIEAADKARVNLVWVAERNACPHCLAYQGHVVKPGMQFPEGLTYGDRPLTPFGPLIGPPLHPHCRCQLEPTDLDAGNLDVALAREAARSVARGLTDYSSETGKFRAADRLLKDASKATPVKLPKSVLERTARNLRAGVFRFRPGSTEAQKEIARRKADRRRSGGKHG